MKDIIGIVGGMGSHAAVYMFKQLINQCPVNKDQEYIEVLIHNNPCIPDRTEGILYHGSNPFPELLRSAKWLEKGGATIIVLACVTAHHYTGKLEKSLKKAKIFHIVKETADYTCRMYPDLRSAGILATEGTCKIGLWQEEFDKRQIKTFMLPEQHQTEYFNKVIYGEKGVKAGYRDDDLKTNLLAGCRKLIEMGAESIIGACSELPIMISQEDLPVPYIDPIQVTVEKIVDHYYGDLR